MTFTLPITLSPLRRLEDRGRRFLAPVKLLDRLDRVRAFIDEELETSGSATNSLVHASLVLAAAEPGHCALERLIPLAAGAQMVHDALMMQQASVQPDCPPDFFGILSHDLALARALDLFTRDGHTQATEAISYGSICLCEALMADRSAESPALIARLLAGFHGACVRIGTGIAQVPPHLEQAMIRQTEDAVHFIAEGDKESNPDMPKEFRATPLFNRVIQRWLNGLTTDETVLSGYRED
jgi:hypothetical protein